jgi:uroporphyrinogen III methyltransferase/synthase
LKSTEDRIEKRRGIVYLVGAGPGDPDLITVKAARILERCDTVVYDNLVPSELIAILPKGVDKRYVGKIAGLHSFSQKAINEQLVALALEGKTVVRLKGGDPFVFGRGGEEAQHLREHGIRYEVVPGITAGLAAPEYSGIPVTDRRTASFVMLVTGHKATEKPVSSVPWEWVGKARDGTLIIYMGVAEIKNIVSGLIDAGMAAETPSAVIERGTCPTQRLVTSPLSDLPARVEEEGIRPPVIFVVGEVVNMAETLRWFEEKPLSGIRVMVARPADQAISLYRDLRDLGAEVLPYPTIATREKLDPAVWGSVKRISGDCQWLVFTSENGVRYFIKQWRKQIGDIRGIARYRIAAVGAGTARALDSYFLSADFIPSEATTQELARQLASEPEFPGSTVVRVRGNLADDTVERTLSEAGASSVVPLQVYETYHPVWPDEMKKKLLTYLPDAVILTSGSSAEGLADILSGDELGKVTARARIFSIGPSTSKKIRSLGMSVDHESAVHTIPAIVEDLVVFYRDLPKGRRK